MRSFAVSDIVRQGSSNVVPFESFVITGAVRDFGSWTAEGVFLRPGVAAEGGNPITAAELDVKGVIPARPGDQLLLSAITQGGAEKEYLFFRRLQPNQFEVIQEWSESPSTTYLVKEGERDPCISELLLAVRNRVRIAEKDKITVEYPLPLIGNGCPVTRESEH
jgi:hypothetical protein